jgi:hypothetical protein
MGWKDFIPEESKIVIINFKKKSGNNVFFYFSKCIT